MQIVSIGDNLHEISNPIFWVKHYENTPIQIYRQFHLQKLKIFTQKTLIFFIFLLKT